MEKILAFVGSSAVGKTTLMMELLKRMPEKVFPIVTTTTRLWRGPEDDVFCKFVSREHIQNLQESGKLAQYLEYAGNIYGCEWADIDWAVNNGFGIQAYVEPAIFDLRKAGYEVIPIKIISDQEIFRDEKRIVEDQERAKISLDYSFGTFGILYHRCSCTLLLYRAVWATHIYIDAIKT
jgi:guanylate kinase